MPDDNPQTNKALGVQVGGTHYTDLAIQPMYYSECNRLTATQHTAIKYITRQKGTLEDRLRDLDKAVHCIGLLKQSLIEDWAGRNSADRIRADIARLQDELQRLEPEQQQAVEARTEPAHRRGNGKTVPADRSVPALRPYTKVRGSA